MPKFSFLRLLGAAAAIGTMTVVAVAGAASALDDAKPTAACGLAYKDPAGDMADHAQDPTGDKTDSSDLLGGFLKYDAGKGAEALTYNIIVKDLKAEVPAGWTTLSWNGYYTTPD